MSRAVFWAMVRAEILKLRRHRGTMATAVALSIGTTIVYFAVVRMRAGSGIDPERVLSSGSTLLALYFGSFTSMLIGTSAATIDRDHGVLRDLLASGRSRVGLFLARVSSALALAVACNTVGFLVTVGAVFLLKEGAPAPSLLLVLEFGGWVVLCTAVVTSLALGIATVTGARALTLTAVIGWQTVATTLLFSAPFLGSARAGLLTVALSHLRPGEPVGTHAHPGSSSALPALLIPMSTTVAVLVILGWVLIPSALGAWRLTRQET
jgi:ABC-type transport system involved in multi-copper enzyme maturation permease subunit